MLEILCIQLVTLPVYITPLCKSTKRHLQSQVWFTYNGLVPPVCFWYSVSGVKAKPVWTSLLMRHPESWEANLLIPQNLPSLGRNDPVDVTCSCFLLFLHLLSSYILTAVLWRRVGESEDNGLLKPLLYDCYAHELPRRLIIILLSSAPLLTCHQQLQEPTVICTGGWEGQPSGWSTATHDSS